MSDNHSSEDPSDDDDSPNSVPSRPPQLTASTTGYQKPAGSSDIHFQNYHISVPQRTTRARCPQTFPFQDLEDTVVPEPKPAWTWPVNDYVKSELLSLYLKKTSRWLESTDSNLHFSSQTGHLVIDSQIIAAAAVTLGSTQFSPNAESSAWFSELFYKFSASLHGSFPRQKREGVVAALILSVYSASTGDISRCFFNLRGCVDLLKEYHLDDSFPELPLACFWACVRLGKQ
jgi:hypothetical protein